MTENKQELNYQIFIDTLHKDFIKIQEEYQNKINQVLEKYKNLPKLIEESVENEYIKHIDNFNQYLDFTEQEIENIERNKARNSRNYNFRYSAVLKICNYVDLPIGWYKCKAEFDIGIKLKYGKHETQIYKCQPLNNTTHDTLKNVMCSDLVAYIFGVADEKKWCFLYPKCIMER